MKELLDDRTSGVVVCLLVRTSGVVVCLLVVHALLVIGGNRTMDVDRSVVHAPSLGKSMKRPQGSQWVAFVSLSSGDSSSESLSGRLVRVVFSQWVYVS